MRTACRNRRSMNDLMGGHVDIACEQALVMPLLGGAILGTVSHLPPSDWRIGSTFFLCAAMQAVGIYVARRYFRQHHMAATATTETGA